MTVKEKKYDASSIKVVQGLDHIRKRPGMYTDPENPNHIGHEVIDNASDEILAGFADRCDITLHRDGSLSVSDNGRGIPVDMHPELGVPAVQVIFCEVNSGGKFDNGDDSAYDFSGGLHGVGVTVTNALSTKIEVEIKRDGEVHFVAFNYGELREPIKVIGKCPDGESGSKVRFWPDSNFFDSSKFVVEKLKKLCKAKAILLENSYFTFTVEAESEGETAIVDEWHFEEGIPEYVEQQLSGSIHTPVFYDKYFWENDEHDNYRVGEGIEWAMCFIQHGKNFRDSYVNLVTTKSGGTHVSGFERGTFEAVKSFASANALMPKGIELRREDVIGKLAFLISAKCSEPTFRGQTKDELLSRYFVALSELCVKAKLESWLAKNYEYGVEIANLAIEAAQNRLKSEKVHVVRKSGTATSPLPDKLSDCTSKVREDIEVFIVEGDSAGGSAKMGRCRKTQAIMPLKGKPINAWDISSDDALTNQELADLSVVLGVKPHTTDDDPTEVLAKVRYQRCIVLADADVDGHHIATLVTANIIKHFPHLITQGHFCIAQPPLFKIEAKKHGKLKPQKHYVQDEVERDNVVARLTKQGYSAEKIMISRFKGLGEMNPDQLKETALDPDTRVLVVPSFDSDGVLYLVRELDFLFAKKESKARREWISTNGDFEKFIN